MSLRSRSKELNLSWNVFLPKKRQALKKIQNFEQNSLIYATKWASIHWLVKLSAKRGAWSMFSDFYNRLGIKILKICEKYKSLNGGVMAIEDIVNINNRSKFNDKITAEDVIASMKSLEVLGTGCTILSKQYISTSPFPFSEDSQKLLQLFKQKGFVNETMVKNSLGWVSERFSLVMAI